MLTEWFDKKEVIIALVSSLVGWGAAWWKGVGKLKGDMAFIKGQLSQLVKIHDKVSTLDQNHAIITRDQQKIRKDVDAAHVGLREIKAVIHTRG